jgi:integrase
LTPTQCAEATDTLRDGGGLVLQVEPFKRGGGYGRSWIWRYSFHNRDRMVGLGSLEKISLDQARVLVAQYRKDWLDAGIDPKTKLQEIKAVQRRRADEAEVKAKEDRAKAKGELVTFKQAVELYVKVPAHLNQWTNDKYRWQWLHQLEKHIFPKLGNAPVATIDRKRVLNVLEPIWGSKTVWDLRSRIEKVLDWCEGKGWRPEGLKNPAAWSTLKKFLPRARKGRHAPVKHPALPYEEIKTFMAALRKERSTAARGLQALILTGVRTGDLRFAQWREFNIKKRLWTIPKERMKMRADAEDRVDHEVPLSDAVLRILNAIKGERNQDDFVFRGCHGRELHNYAMRRICRKIRPDVTDHGFRSTFRDWCGDETEHDSQTARMALAHKVGGVDGHYRRRTALEKRRDLMTRWAQYCEPVTPLRVVA